MAGILSSFLVSCNSSSNGTYSDERDANQRWVSQGNSCSKYDKYNPKDAVAWVNCQKNAYYHFYEHDPNSDLMGLLLTKYAVLAEKYEKGKLSSSEYTLASQEAAVEFKNSVLARDNANSIASSQRDMANAARLRQFLYLKRMTNQNY